MRNVSDTLKSAVFGQETDEVFIALITISGDNLAEPLYICSDPYETLPIANVSGVVSNGIEYIYLPFELSLANEDDSGIAQCKIVLDNIGRDAMVGIRTATRALNVNISIVLSSDPDNVEINLPDFRLVDVSYDALTIEGNLAVDFLDLEPFPYQRFTPAGTPGVF